MSPMRKKKLEASPALGAYHEFLERHVAFQKTVASAMRGRAKQIRRRVASGRTKKVRSKTLDRLSAGIGTSMEWLMVLFVVAIESYLVDLLSWAAESDPR